MKKILVTLVLIGFTTISANASTSVYYGNTGVPIGKTVGTGSMESMNNFGSNAGFTPANIRKQEAIERAKRHEDQYYNSLEKGRNVNINITKPTMQNTNSNTNTNIVTEKEQATTTTETTEITPKTKTPAKKINKKPVTKSGVTYY